MAILPKAFFCLQGLEVFFSLKGVSTSTMCAEKEWMQMGMLAFTDAYSLLQLQGHCPHSFQCFFFLYIFFISYQVEF